MGYDTIKEKLADTLRLTGWLRHFRGLSATAQCSKFVVLWSHGVKLREESEHNTIQDHTSRLDRMTVYHESNDVK